MNQEIDRDRSRPSCLSLVDVGDRVDWDVDKIEEYLFTCWTNVRILSL